jgi:hypothetical protein
LLRREKVKTKGFIKPLALGRMGGRVRVRNGQWGEYRFEFARGGEGVGKGGVKGLSSRAEVREKVRGE